MVPVYDSIPRSTLSLSSNRQGVQTKKKMTLVCSLKDFRDVSVHDESLGALFPLGMRQMVLPFKDSVYVTLLNS